MIKNPESVDLDANFNLVYGDEGANDMKASILLGKLLKSTVFRLHNLFSFQNSI